MKAHPKVVSYLQRAVSHEFGATQQYVVHAAAAKALGLSAMSQQLHEEAVGEMEHAMEFLERMNALGIPATSTGKDFPVGRTLKDILVYAMQTEDAAVRLYEEAQLFCTRINDEDNRVLFARILEDEKKHYADLQQQLKSL